MNAQANTGLKGFFAAWTDSLALLLLRLRSGTWQAAMRDGGPVSSVVWVGVSAAGWPGRLWLGWSADEAAKLLQLFLGEPVGIAEEPDSTQKEALEELTRQWCGLAATALEPCHGEVAFNATLETATAGRHSASHCCIASDGAESIAVSMVLDPELEKFLVEPATSLSGEGATVARSSGASVDELERQGNLDLLLEVELPVMLRFGTREAKLREVLDLAAGAVLELNREVQEPVDLVLHGKLIARGEVVVVDGNYGLRVTEVASPQQRVSSL